MKTVRAIIIYTCIAVAAMCETHAQSIMSVRGKASYYHDRFHGRRTASGTIYHKDSMTCAHLRYPFGTMLKVRNISNGKEVTVKVTDRGPYSKRFVIDLSKAAARHIDILAGGHADVEITALVSPQVPYRIDWDTIRLEPLPLLPDTLPFFIPSPDDLQP